MDQWSRDHWNLLAYVETCCVDDHGKLVYERMRCNPREHPHQLGRRSAEQVWQATYATRLRGFDEVTAPTKRVRNHDDFHCLDDFEAAGLMFVTSAYDAAVLSPVGGAWAARLRAHRAAGKTFKSFEPDTTVVPS